MAQGAERKASVGQISEIRMAQGAERKASVGQIIKTVS
jgi:hypothetical protein